MIERSPHALLAAAEKKQNAAADPGSSVWVRANAGTGKTYVLVQRILRLLLTGAPPRSILCLTFTKNAAAEMETRVLARLGEWATADKETMTAGLAKLLGRPPSEAELALAPCLFASAIDAPGGLPIQTIHGFCERVLRRYSFEANVPPGFTVLTEEEARDALGQAQAEAFASAKQGPLREALATVVAHAGETDFARVLEAMLAQRGKIAQLLQVVGEQNPFGAIEDSLRSLFKVGRGETSHSLLARSASLLPDGVLAELIAVLFEGGAKSDRDMALRLHAAAAAEDGDVRHAALKTAFATDKGEARKSLMTAAVKKRAPALNDRLVAAQSAFLALDEQICGLKVVAATMALLRLAAAIFERYEAGKRARAAVDFDDLIARTFGLLSREDAAEWVLYQLDGRIDHILVDEAQDTSPEQWEIVEKLTSDFFSGEGARTSAPTLFAVGDEKQSIYGFQGAAPDLLAHFGRAYEKKARQAGFHWRSVDLNLSFRTLAPILAAVDSVTSILPGMKEEPRAPHVAYRPEGFGLVELWEPEKGEKEEKRTVWEEAPASPAAKPAEALAGRIVSQIKHWLDSGAMLASAGRPIEPGDILILLRKRAPMAGLLQAGLKRAGIAVCGADRIALLEELAIMDLMALASAALQPEDDLALAEVLKSPLFGFSDDALFKIGFGRTGSLWRALEAAGDGDPTLAAAAAKLSAWRERALHASPFDFFSSILEAEGGREIFAARLGVECFDAFDELLNLAEAFGARGALSLADFLVSLRRGVLEVKRETSHAAQEVRIMTIHGAKGLEANIVILADACSNRGASSAPLHFVRPADGAVALPVWAIKGASRLPPIAETKSELKDEERRELARLLYVAMTRARDHLCITGFHKGDLPAGCWYETVKNALEPTLERGEDLQGRPAWRHGALTPAQSRASSLKKARETAMPSWLGVCAPEEAGLLILSPSKLGSGIELRASEHPKRERNRARAWGLLVHRFLEVLPQLPEADRTGAANAIALAFAAELPARERESAIASTLMSLSNELFARRKGLSLDEAGIAITLLDPLGKRRAVLMGQVDHILLEGDEISILDYKSGADEAGVRPAHSAQLAAYSLGVRRLYPDAAKVNAELFNTRSMEVHRVEASALDAFLEQLSNTIGAESLSHVA